LRGTQKCIGNNFYIIDGVTAAIGNYKIENKTSIKPSLETKKRQFNV
jgi:large exoprotein involved in heme utilization and adhesion